MSSFDRVQHDALMARVARRVDDKRVLRLLRVDPFHGEPPQAVRARLYRYRFTTRAERRQTRAWWSRSLVGEFRRPVQLARAR